MYYHRYKTDNPTQNMFHRHIHNDFEILYFVSGDADFIIEGNICRLNKGDLLLIKPRVYHYLRLRSNTKYERFVINFTEGEVESVISDGDDRYEYAKYNIPEKSVISSFFKAWDEYEEVFEDDERDIFIKHGIEVLLTALKHCVKKADDLPLNSNPTLEPILRYIDENLDKPMSAESLSSEFYVSVSWLVHIFRSHLGISLMQYVNKKRMLYAQQLVKEGMSPTEVAAHCNFENYATFYRQYKKILGKSPKDDKSSTAVSKK